LPDDLRILRASEIGEYVFCHRAWWLDRIQGVESANRGQMDAGVARHLAHGHAVQRSDSLGRAARLFLIVALLFAILFFLAMLSSPH
jgi:hypothetical protein